MKFLPPLSCGRLIRRYKRFLVDIEMPDGSQLTMHCPNTGSMLNCGESGDRVWFSRSENPKRKYPHTLELVEVAPGVLVGINTSRANALVREAIGDNVISSLNGYASLQAEVKYGTENSRIDFLLRRHPQRPEEDCYVEVKNVTLGYTGGVGRFPDAVTARGSRHLRELMQVRDAGHRAVLFFCVQHSAIEVVKPADGIDPVYAETLRRAASMGVEVIAWRTLAGPDEIRLATELEVDLHPR